MSTGLECSFFCLAATPEPEWFYLLEDWDSPRGAWDWTEHATAYGPFKTFDAAHAHLSRNHANPGSFSKDESPRDPAEMGDHLAELIVAARSRRR